MSKRKQEVEARSLEFDFQSEAAVVRPAREWLEETTHRKGCQCHRCFWAHGVLAGRISVGFETWRCR